MNKNNFTAAQLKWASEHDWFLCGTQQSITGQSDIVDCNQQPPRHIGMERKTFTSFRELRDWAGY